MDKIDIKKFKDMCEENTALTLRVANLQHQLQKEVEDLFIRSKGKYLIFKVSEESYYDIGPITKRRKYQHYFPTDKKYLYMGELDYIENLPEGFDASGYPDTILIKNPKGYFIIVDDYDSDDLEYGMFVRATNVRGTEYIPAFSIFKIGYMSSNIFDHILLFNTEDEAKLLWR